MKRKLSIPLPQLNWRQALREYTLMTIGALLLIVSFNLFQAPAQMAPGGVSGVSILVNRFTGWPPGLIMLVVNIPLILLGFRTLGRYRFVVRTLYVTLIFNLGVDIFAIWLPADGLTDDLLLNALYGGVIGGIGGGLIFLGRSTVAGSGIISRIIQLRTGIPLSQLFVLIDGGVILLLGVVFGWEKALYAFIMLFIWGLATDYVQEGPSMVRTVFIVTNSAEAVAEVILHRLGVGVTAWPAQGMFTHSERMTLFCTVSRSDVTTLRQIVAELDPAAFVVIGQGHQASGGVLRGKH